jgi:hypothetical protein
MRALSRSVAFRVSGQWAVLVRALAVLAIAAAVIVPLVD